MSAGAAVRLHPQTLRVRQASCAARRTTMQRAVAEGPAPPSWIRHQGQHGPLVNVSMARVYVGRTHQNRPTRTRVTVPPTAGETISGTDVALSGGGKGGNQIVAAALARDTVITPDALGEDSNGHYRRPDDGSAHRPHDDRRGRAG
jgi:hypothetical protein